MHTNTTGRATDRPQPCEHDYKNRTSTMGEGPYKRTLHTGLGAECTKCGKELRHDFDPLTDRGHPVGMKCRRCGTTEWQYVEGVLCHMHWRHRG